MSTHVDEIAFLAGAAGNDKLEQIRERLLRSNIERREELRKQQPQDAENAEARIATLQQAEEAIRRIRDDIQSVVEASLEPISTSANVFAGDSLRTVILLLSQGGAWWAAANLLGSTMRADWPWRLRAMIVLAGMSVIGGTALLHYFSKLAMMPRPRGSMPRRVIHALWVLFAISVLVGLAMLFNPQPPAIWSGGLLVAGSLTSQLALWLGTWRPTDAASRFIAECEDRLNEIHGAWRTANRDLVVEYDTLRTLQTRTIREIQELDEQLRSDAEAIDRAFELGRVSKRT